MLSYPWFGTWGSGGNLQQGLIIPDFSFPDLDTIPVYKKDGSKTVTIDYEKFDAIILSQSCDLKGKRIPFIHVCPVFKLEQMFNEKPIHYQHQNNRKGDHEKLAKGYFTNRYMTAKLTTYGVNALKSDKTKTFSPSFDKYKNDRIIIDFTQAVVVSTKYLKKFVKPKTEYLILNPPYRESMAQRYGLFFSRIGNPIDHKDIKPSEYTIVPPPVS